MQGFEPRGTLISQRLTAWRNLLDETRPSGLLIANPNELIAQKNRFTKVRFASLHAYVFYLQNKFVFDQLQKKLGDLNKGKHKKIKFKKKIKFIKDNNNNNTGKVNYDFFDEFSDDSNRTAVNRTEQWHYGKNQSFTDEEEYNEKVQQKNKQWKMLQKPNPPPAIIDEHIRMDGFFCEAPSKLENVLVWSYSFINILLNRHRVRTFCCETSQSQFNGISVRNQCIVGNV